jgi:hypothetical protein
MRLFPIVARFVAVCGLAWIGSDAAHCQTYPLLTTITPSAPTTSNVVDVRVQGTLGDAASLVQVSNVGNAIYIEPVFVGLPGVFPFDKTFQFGPLPVGTYIVNVRYFGTATLLSAPLAFSVVAGAPQGERIPTLSTIMILALSVLVAVVAIGRLRVWVATLAILIFGSMQAGTALAQSSTNMADAAGSPALDFGTVNATLIFGGVSGDIPLAGRF